MNWRVTKHQGMNRGELTTSKNGSPLLTKEPQCFRDISDGAVAYGNWSEVIVMVGCMWGLCTVYINRSVYKGLMFAGMLSFHFFRSIGPGPFGIHK